MDKRDGIFDAPKQLGWGETIVLGIQHMFAMFGATILVPILTGLSVQVTLFCAGLGTLIFHLLTKGKVPAFLGSSFAFLAGYWAIAGNPEGSAGFTHGIFASMDKVEKLQYASGGIIVAGLVYLLMSGLITLVGIKKVLRFIPPIVTGPIIILIGLNLAGTAVSSAMTNWPLAILAIVIIIVFNIWGKGMAKIIPILLGILIPSLVALLWNFGAAAIGGTLSDFWASVMTVLTEGKVVGIQPFKLAKFDISAILVMAPIALATMMEHIGDVSAISATVGKNFTKDPGLNRTLLGDGIATSLAGLIGGPANTTYGENTGVLALTKVYDPKVIRIAAVAAMVLSFSPIFANIIGAVPTAVIGGVSFILYGMISAIGVRNIVENKVDLTKPRNLIIAAIVLVSGLGFQQYPIEFTIGEATLSFGGLACAAIFGIIINAILPGKDDISEEAQPQFFDYNADEAEQETSQKEKTTPKEGK